MGTTNLDSLILSGNLTVAGTLDAGSINETAIINTAITTVGNGTLTAAGIIGGLITRTGPVVAFTDTTDTAVAMVAAVTTPFVGQTFFISIKNATPYLQTISPGTGVTLPPTAIIGPFEIGNYYITFTSLTTVAFTHFGTTAIASSTSTVTPLITALATVGAGTITAAGINGGLTARSGSQSATPFTDTTDIAASIIAGNPGLVGKIGSSFLYYYANTTNALATISGGTGVTVSGITTIPAGMTGGFLLTYTAAATITMVGIGLTNNISTAMALAGSSSGQTIIQPSAVASGTLTLPASTGTLATIALAPVAVGASLSLTAAMSGSAILLNTAAGSTATLPAASGSGNTYKFFVTTTATSNAHKILAASSSDFLNGIVTGETAGTAKCFASAAATNHSIQMPFAGTQPSGGFIGDWFEFVDVAANLWSVKGMYQAGVTPTTPFSAATT